jgi:hypothetical protein
MLFARTGTPKEIVDRLHTEMSRIIATPELQDRMTSLGLIPYPPPPIAQSQAYIKSEIEKWGGLVKSLGLGGVFSAFDDPADGDYQQAMSAYAAVDPLLNAWARDKRVHVLTHYRDTEIRSIAIYGPGDEQGQMWLDDIDEYGMVGVHTAASDGFRADRRSALPHLATVLSEAYDELSRHVPSWEGRNPYAPSKG